MRTCCALLLGIGLLLGAEADPTTEVITTDGAVALARAHAESALASQARLSANRQLARADRARLLPQVSAAATWLRHGDRGSAPVLEESGDDWAIGGRVDQVLYAPDLYGSTLATARNRTEQGAAAHTASLRDVERAARGAITSWALADAGVAIAEERLGQRQDEYDRTVRLADPAVGLSDQLSVDQANLNLLAAKQGLRTAANTRDEAYENVAQAIARDSGSFTIAADLEAAASTAMADSFTATAGPDIALAQSRAIDAELLERQVRLADRPVLSAFASADWLGDDPDDLEEDWALGLSLTWQLYDGGGNRARARAARLQASAARLDAQALERDRTRQFHQLRLRLASLTDRIKAAEEAVKVAQRSYKRALQSYENGLIDLTRLGTFSLAVGEQGYQLAILKARYRNAIDDLRALVTT